MSDTATKELVNALNDPEEPLTPEVEEAAVSVAGVLKNVLKSSSGTSQATGSTPADSSSLKVQTNKKNIYFFGSVSSIIRPGNDIISHADFLIQKHKQPDLGILPEIYMFIIACN